MRLLFRFIKFIILGIILKIGFKVLGIVLRGLFTLMKRAFYSIREFFKSRNRGADYLTMEQIDKLGNNGKDFETYVCRLYRNLGYEAYTTTELREMGKLPKLIMGQSGSGEQGADVIVYKNTNKGKLTLIVQCKQYSNTVGNSAVQEVFSALAMYHGHEGVVITNNTFTPHAKNLAKAINENNHNPYKVNLIDRQGLRDFVEQATKKVA